jgi:hypothetical protein
MAGVGYARGDQAAAAAAAAQAWVV